uniref:Coiled-coil domain containing 136 n=1 Tax=Molossus molossus TaxID=27622 RepID=A0A7J8H9Y7_MOLMO|nr:coiled-coil domain containing 136 [Molossus molossus]
MRSKSCRSSCGSCSCSTRPAWTSRAGSWRCRSSWRGSCSAARKSFASSKSRGPLLPRARMPVRT